MYPILLVILFKSAIAIWFFWGKTQNVSTEGAWGKLRGVVARLPHSKYSSLEPFTSNSDSQFDTKHRSMQYIPQTELHRKHWSLSSQKSRSPTYFQFFATASL
ncbi:MAG: hypothetical protein P2A85_16185 [Microcoleus anatoxicus]|uniref:hypothetical protein n=1 Tax=Microcoleus anatoxicus TaxID=2705319 RepID=UPI00366FDDAB